MSAQPRTFQAPVFSLQQITPVRTAGQARTEYFAPLERHSSARAVSTLPSIRAELPTGKQGIVVQGLDSSLDIPTWMRPVLESLNERWGHKEGWDSYNAKPTSPCLVETLLNELATVMQHASPAPFMVPLADGGMQAEWHRKQQDFELVVSADEQPRYYYFNELTSEEEEGPVEGNIQRLRTFLARL